MHPIKQFAGGAAIAAAVAGLGTIGAHLGDEMTASTIPAATVNAAPTLTITLPHPCAEDDPCWTWSRMGNRRRRVLVAGAPRVVGTCTYRQLRIAGRLDPATSRLRGDSWALKNGCGAGASVAVHPSGVVEG